MKDQDEELEQRYRDLQQDWTCFKQSHRRRQSIQSLDEPDSFIQQNLDFFNTSPRALLLSLQKDQAPSEKWRVRNNNMAIEEVLKERRAAMANGKLKGKRLLEVLDKVAEVGLQGNAEFSSVGSSVLIQGSSSSVSSSSLSGDVSVESSSSLKREKVGFVDEVGVTEKEKIVFVGGGGGGDWDNDGRWMLKMGLLAIVVLFVALGIICVKSLDVEGEYEGLVPT